MSYYFFVFLPSGILTHLLDYQLFEAGGLSFAEYLHSTEYNVFLISKTLL